MREAQIEPNPQPLRALYAAALEQQQQGRLDAAEQLCRRILAADPDHADGLHLLGILACQTGRIALAEASIRQAIASHGQDAAYHSNLGVALRTAGRTVEAIASFRAALAVQPDFCDAHVNLGSVLRDQGQKEAALGCFLRARVLRPTDPHILDALGRVLWDLQRLEEAIACFRQALALRPEDPSLLGNLAQALWDDGRLEAAAAGFRRCLALRPDDADTYVRLGRVLQQQGQLAAAAGSFRRAVALCPDHADAHANLGLALLAQGALAEGWAEYEWRWQSTYLRSQRRDFAQPQWRGEAAAGRTLLLHAEQGFGDTLQFCRYAPIAAARGLRVILEVPQPLVRLLRTLPGVDQVLPWGAPLPPFDLHCLMMSMPLALGTTLDAIPSATCYLRADAAQAAGWAARLAPGRGLRVGLAWAGNPRTGAAALAALSAAIDRRRSLPPALLAPLFALADVRFFSLQKDGPPAPRNFPITNAMAEMRDFADTAALITNLDLVISVDTAVAHLAASLGRPVWLLDRHDPCWRWLTGRRDSPWYPTLRIYRQPAPGDWPAVIVEVAGDLRALAARRGPARAATG